LMARRERRGAKGPRKRAAGAGRGAPATENDARAKAVEGILRDAARLHERAAGESAGGVVAVADALQVAFGSGAKVLIFGNGGSAADAQHFACELVGRFLRERRAMPAIALTADTTAVTAIANDYGFDRVFVRQIEAHGRPGDVAVGISTSGTSANVLAGLEYAKSRGLKTVAFTGGSGGPIGAAADVHVNVPHDLTPRVQEVHRTLIHAVCELVEQRMDSNG
jgi:D-sedoheptulose 7-phosphate isomerase